MKKLITFAIVGLIAALSLLSYLPDKNLHVYFVDVGQGDSIFIKTPLNQKIIIDGGPDLSLIDKLNGLMEPFVHDVDLLVLTHPHRDHFYGFLELIDRYSVKAILLTGISYESSDYRYFLDAVYTKNIPVYLAQSDQDFYFGSKLFLDIVYPHAPSLGLKKENVNDDSIVIKLTYGQNSILLVGDAEKEEETEMLLSPFDYEADVLKAGHHGSRTSSSTPFLKAVKAQYITISAGKGNQFGHPHRETVAKFLDKKLFRTDIQGNIEMIFDEEKLLDVFTQKSVD